MDEDNALHCGAALVRQQQRYITGSSVSMLGLTADMAYVTDMALHA
jgi:hypothetical protein